VGTAKRERKKANRQQRLQQLEKQRKQERVKRRGLQLGIGIPVAIGVLVLIIWAVTVSDNDDSAAPGDTTAPVTETLPGEESTDSTAPASSVTPGEALPCPAEDGSSPKTQTFGAAPPVCIDTTTTYVAKVTTNKGEFTIELDASRAPQTVNNFVYLARYHYFDGITCHRIIPGFVVQCGDPEGTGMGGPGYSFADELPAAGEYQLGSLAMANSGPNTNGSQFFIITGENGAKLPPSYSLFGQVTEGFDSTVKSMEAAGSPSGAPGEPIVLESVVISEKSGTTAPTTAAPATSAN